MMGYRPPPLLPIPSWWSTGPISTALRRHSGHAVAVVVAVRGAGDRQRQRAERISRFFFSPASILQSNAYATQLLLLPIDDDLLREQRLSRKPFLYQVLSMGPHRTHESCARFHPGGPATSHVLSRVRTRMNKKEYIENFSQISEFSAIF